MAAEADDLEALFDSIAQSRPQELAGVTKVSAAEPDQAAPDLYEQVGRCTRQLHDAMRELGYDHVLVQATSEISNAKDRLEYVAQLTEQAATKVLNAVDAGMPEQDMLLKQSRALSESWDLLFSGKMSIEEFKVLASESRSFALQVGQTAERQKARLMEIMMAQDFQDITGQIIKKIVSITQAHEQELAKILRDNAPDTPLPRTEEKQVDLMAGPAVPGNALAQDDVDDLLASLGF